MNSPHFSTSTPYPYTSNQDADGHNPPALVDNAVVDILRAAILRGDLANIPERISDAISGRTTVNPNVLRMLMLCLDKIGVNFCLDQIGVNFHSSARCALANKPLLTCSRCCQQYREAENGPRACLVPHAAPLVLWNVGNVSDLYEHTDVQPQVRYYPCCGINMVADPSQTLSGACYVGSHLPYVQWSDAFPVHQAGGQAHHYSDVLSPMHDVSHGDINAAAPYLPPPSNTSPPSLTATPTPTMDPGTSHPIKQPRAQHPHHTAGAQQQEGRTTASPRVGEKVLWDETGLYHPPGIPSALPGRWGNPSGYVQS